MIIMAVQKETKRNQSNKTKFSGMKYEDRVLHFQAEKMDPMSELEVNNHVLGEVMTQQYILIAGQKHSR